VVGTQGKIKTFDSEGSDTNIFKKQISCVTDFTQLSKLASIFCFYFQFILSMIFFIIYLFLILVNLHQYRILVADKIRSDQIC